jgi:small subunit ribosomal protein S3e
VFFAELNELFTRLLSADGYFGCEVMATPQGTKIIIRASNPKNVLGEKGVRLRELISIVEKRFGHPEGSVSLFVERMEARGLSAIAQAESLKLKLLGAAAVRKACMTVMKTIMESGAKGCEVVVSGKLRGQRAKSMKFVDGMMIHAGQPAKEYIDYAVRHVLLRQGVLGVKVKIFLNHDPTGRLGPKNRIPDQVTINEPKDE